MSTHDPLKFLFHRPAERDGARPGVAEGAARLVGEVLGRPFREVDPELVRSVNTRNRGWVGQWLERRLGLVNGNATLDFADGELKSFETARALRPVHGQVAVATIDDPEALLDAPPFEESIVAAKLARVLFAGYRKPTADPGDWTLAFVLLFELDACAGLRDRLADSYERLVRDFAADARHADEDSVLRDHTYRDDLLILKNKDSRQEGRYGATWSTEYDGPISARRLGFYLTPGFFDALADEPGVRRWSA